MKGFIQLTAINTGLPVVIRTDCIEHIRQLPADGVHSARTTVHTGDGKRDIVTETAEEIKQKMVADMHDAIDEKMCKASIKLGKLLGSQRVIHEFNSRLRR
jgi:hypothetical protein